MTDHPALPPVLRNNVLSLRYLLLGFVLSWLPLPVSGLAVIPLVISLYYGVRYLGDIRRAGLTGAVLPNMIGLALTAALIAMVAAPLVQYQQTLDYQECLWGANTQQAHDACQSAYDEHPGTLQKLFLG